MATYGQKKCFISKLTDTATASVEGVGVVRYEGNKRYKYVQYHTGTDSVTAAAGNVCYYASAGAYAVAKATGSLGSSTGEIGCGVMQGTATNAAWCWVQTGGPATYSVPLTAGSDGDPLTPTGASDGTLDIQSATAGTVTSAVCAFADDVSLKSIFCSFPM